MTRRGTVYWLKNKRFRHTDFPLFERFVTKDNEKADELSKEGAMMNGGGMPQSRVSTVQQ